MDIDVHLHDWQCNSEEYLLNLPNTGGNFIAYPKWECLNNATITSGQFSILTLDFSQQSAKLKGTFTVIGEAVDLIIRAGQEVYLSDIDFVNFRKVLIDNESTSKLWLKDLKALNSNGKTTELIANISYLNLSGDIKVDGVTKVTLTDIGNVQAILDTRQLKLFSATEMHWDIKSKTTTTLYGKIEGINLNLSAQGSVLIDGVVLSNQINASIQGGVVVKNWLESKSGFIQSNSILIYEGGTLKVADDGFGDNLLKINLPHSFHNKKEGAVLGGGYDIKSASFQNDGGFNVSSLKVDVEKDLVNNELLTIRNKDGEINVKGKLFNNKEINAEQGILKIIYNPDNAFVAGKFYGTKGVYIGYPQNYKVSNLTQLNGSGVSEIYSSKGEVRIDAAKWKVHPNQKVIASTVLTVNTGSYSLENYGEIKGGKISFKLAQKLINHGTIEYGDGSSVKALEVELAKGLVSGDGIEFIVNNTFNFIDGAFQGKSGELVIQAPVINMAGNAEINSLAKLITDELYFKKGSEALVRNKVYVQGLTSKNAKVIDIDSGKVEVRDDAYLDADRLVVKRSIIVDEKQTVAKFYYDGAERGIKKTIITNRLTHNLYSVDDFKGSKLFESCIENKLISSSALASLNILGNLYFGGKEIDNTYGIIGIGKDLYLSVHTSIKNQGKLLKELHVGRSYSQEVRDYCSKQSISPAVFYVVAKVHGQLSDINNVIVVGRVAEFGKVPSLSGIDEAASKLSVSNLNGVSAAPNAVGTTNIDPNRLVTTDQQHINIADDFKFSRFSRDFYQINYVPTAYMSYYTYYIQERYPALVECSYGMADHLKSMGIPPEKVPPLLCTPNIQASLVSKALEELTGVTYLINEGNAGKFLKAISGENYAVGVLEDERRFDLECLQLELLLKSCQANAHKYGYAFPKGIDESNIANIKEPFVCPVTKMFNGKELVSLELYLPQELIRNSFAWQGAFLGFGEWDSISSDNLINSGRLSSKKAGTIKTQFIGNSGQLIAGEGNLAVEAEMVINTGAIAGEGVNFAVSGNFISTGSIEGDEVKLKARNIGIAGEVSARSNLEITAYNQLVIATLKSVMEIRGYNYYTFISEVVKETKLSSGGELYLSSGDDLNIIGAGVVGQKVHLQSKSGKVVVVPVELYQKAIATGKKYYYERQSLSYYQARIEALNENELDIKNGLVRLSNEVSHGGATGIIIEAGSGILLSGVNVATDRKLRLVSKEDDIKIETPEEYSSMVYSYGTVNKIICII